MPPSDRGAVDGRSLAGGGRRLAPGLNEWRSLIGSIRQGFDHRKIHDEERACEHERPAKRHGVVHRAPVRTLQAEHHEQRAKTRKDRKEDSADHWHEEPRVLERGRALRK